MQVRDLAAVIDPGADEDEEEEEDNTSSYPNPASASHQGSYRAHRIIEYLRSQRGFAFEDYDWVIVGGESGPKSRPMRPDWVRDIRDQCQHVSVPFFKQWGGKNKKQARRMLDGRLWDEMPLTNDRLGYS